MQPSNEYPFQTEVSLESSDAFVPSKLTYFLQMLIDSQALNESDPSYTSKESIKRRYLIIAECIIYSRRCQQKSKQIIPPFHIGLMLQLQHEYGSRTLIETLSSYGLCGSYSDMRRFLTALAHDEVAKQQTDTYVPTGIIHRNDGGRLIQEGDDNADINVETIDAKRQYHVMARVLFQDQAIESDKPISRIQKTTETTLKLSKDTTVKIFPFQKANTRPEPVRQQGVFERLDTSLMCHGFDTVHDLAWIMLRQVSRGILPDSEPKNQTIPFWKGYNTLVCNVPQDVASMCVGATETVITCITWK